MQKFSADAFYTIARYLNDVHQTIEQDFKGGKTRESQVGSLKPDSDGFKWLHVIKLNCEKIGLTLSVKCINNLITTNEKESKLGDQMDQLANLQRTIKYEMEDKLFMYIPPDRASFYDCREMFGADVNAKFPEIQFDLVEAGNCYASGRGTAAVFHLMRIMEIGVQRFGAKLGVALTNEKNWQNILDEINKAIKSLPKSPATVEMSEAAANLYAVKLAWRNEVMHPKDTYTLEEADNLIRQVRLFMQQLSKIV